MIQLGYMVNSNMNFNSNIMEESMLEYYNNFESFRESWSVDHETEIRRLEQFYKLI